MMGKKRANGVTDDQVMESYQRLRSAYEVGRELGIAPTTIYRVLEKRGIERVGLEDRYKRSARFDDGKAKQIRQAYENGQSFADLVRDFGGTEYSVKSAIRRVGGKLLPVCPRLSAEEEAQCVAWHEQGISQSKIAIRLGRSQSLISRIFAQRGLTKLTREQHGSWKGGRWKRADGYMYVLIERDDPLSSMVLKNGYVLEHRLVMARKLGRVLAAHESVHHINGKRDDNRPENLQLRQERHGKHVVMACLDCGSHNIGPMPIAET